MRSLIAWAVAAVVFCGCAPMLPKGGITPADKAGEDAYTEAGDEPETVYKITVTKPAPTAEVPAKPKEKWEPKPMFPEAQQPPTQKQNPAPQPTVVTTPPQPEPASTPYVDAAARQAADEAAAIALQARETAENAANLANETAKVVIATATAGQQGSGSSGTSASATKPTYITPNVPTDCKTNTAKELLFKNNHTLPVYLRIDTIYTTRWVQPNQTLLVCLPAETTKHVIEAFAGENGAITQKAVSNPSMSIWDTDKYVGARGGPYLALGSSNFRGYIPPNQPSKK